MSKAGLVENMEKLILDYVAFTNPLYALVGAVWAMATHCFPLFDAFAYICIMSKTKQSGKTRFSELLGFMSRYPQNSAMFTPSTLFRKMGQGPTLIFDEAEILNSETSPLRAVLNVGYRKGQTVPRTIGGQVIEFPTYCPKIFILIGDVYDTLRDRSIVIEMQRAEPRKRFLHEDVKTEGNLYAKDCQKMLDKDGSRTLDVLATYEDMRRHPEKFGDFFASDRDEEIWTPLLAVCKVVAPHRLDDLKRAAADLCGMKTAPARKYTKIEGEEQKVMEDQYRKRLLQDVAAVMHGANVRSTELLERLYALPTAPWRTFRGEGLDASAMARMLRMHVAPKPLRFGKKVVKGYAWKDVQKQLAALEGSGQ